MGKWTELVSIDRCVNLLSDIYTYYCVSDWSSVVPITHYCLTEIDGTNLVPRPACIKAADVLHHIAVAGAE